MMRQQVFSLVCHGNSVLSKMAMNICVLKILD